MTCAYCSVLLSLSNNIFFSMLQTTIRKSYYNTAEVRRQQIVWPEHFFLSWILLLNCEKKLWNRPKLYKKVKILDKIVENFHNCGNSAHTSGKVKAYTKGDRYAPSTDTHQLLAAVSAYPRYSSVSAVADSSSLFCLRISHWGYNSRPPNYGKTFE